MTVMLFLSMTFAHVTTSRPDGFGCVRCDDAAREVPSNWVCWRSDEGVLSAPDVRRLCDAAVMK
jgi:hypothetical protein